MFYKIFFRIKAAAVQKVVSVFRGISHKHSLQDDIYVQCEKSKKAIANTKKISHSLWELLRLYLWITFLPVLAFACQQGHLALGASSAQKTLENENVIETSGNEIEILKPESKCIAIASGRASRPKPPSFDNSINNENVMLANGSQYNVVIKWTAHQDYHNCTLPRGSNNILERRKRSRADAAFTDDNTGWEDISSRVSKLSDAKSGEYVIPSITWYSKYQYRLRLSIPSYGESENANILEFETKALPKPMRLEAKLASPQSLIMQVRWMVKEEVYNDSGISYHLRWRQKPSGDADFAIDSWQHLLASLGRYESSFYSNRVYFQNHLGTRGLDYEWQVRTCADIDITDTTSVRGVSESNPSCSPFARAQVSIPLATPAPAAPDDDRDGKPNREDNCPNGEAVWLRNASTDHDDDGCRDATEDLDDDNDGVNDVDANGDPLDMCSKGEKNWTSYASVSDYDRDGCRDGTAEDPNSDGDQYPDDNDNCDTVVNDQSNLDGDDKGDACDNDIDGDGVDNNMDACPTGKIGWISTLLEDYDADGCRDSDEDKDDDGDSIDDSNDSCNPTLRSILVGKPAMNWENNATSDLDSDGCRDSDEDVDDDNNGLIEIHSLTEFSYIRHNLAGTSLDDEADDVDDPGDNTDDNGEDMGDISGHPRSEPTNCSGRDTTLMIDGAAVTTYLCGYEIVLNNGPLLDLSGETNWQPIGSCGGDADTNGDVCGDSDDILFTAILDATHSNHNTVMSGLSINRRGSDAQGLFAGLGSGAIVRNLSLTLVNVNGGNRVGALCGWSGDAVVEDAFVTGRVSGTSYVGGLIGESEATIKRSYVSANGMADSVSGNTSVGGLVGVNNGAISLSYATIQVTGRANSIGGLVGRNSGDIDKSYVSATVSGNNNVGGLVGYDTVMAGNTSSISNSYATGIVSGNNNVGGLVGHSIVSGASSSLTISNSYSWASVSANDNVGGLMGHIVVSESSLSISNSYVAGLVSGVNSVGGLVGHSDVSGAGSGMTVSHGYWDKLITGHANSSDALELGDVGYNRISNTYRNLETHYMKSAAPSTVIRNMGSAYVYVSGSYPRLAGVGNSLSNSYDGDGDGVIDAQEIACGSNPLASSSKPMDTDSDGNCNLHDADDDNDGRNDVVELACGSDPLATAIVPLDTDGDGNCDNLDDDDDGDGWSDSLERLCGSDPLSSTSTLAGDELCIIPVSTSDSDGDGIPDLTDVDDDNDGLIDVYTLEDLHNIRYNLAGTSYTNSNGMSSTAGAPSTLPLACTGRTTTTNLCGYELMATLDFHSGCIALNNSTPSYNGDDYCTTNTNSPYHNNGKGWKPIGGQHSSQFTAIFEGNRNLGWEIRNMYINESRTDFPSQYLGLFGDVSNTAILQNINMAQVNINGTVRNSLIHSHTGGLVGRNMGGSIRNSSVTGRIIGKDNVGGLVGYNSEGSIRNSYARASVSGDEHVGGLVGRNAASGFSSASAIAEILNSYARGNVSGNNNVGGLVGYNSGSGDNDFGNEGTARIVNSYASGSVIAVMSNVGGLVGYNASRGGNGRYSGGGGNGYTLIRYSYATGNVTADGNNATNLGGLVGHNSSRGGDGLYGSDGNSSNNNIRETYSTSSVTANGSDATNIGGLIGYNSSRGGDGAVGDNGGGGNNEIRNSYATGSVTANGSNATNIGGFVGYNSSRSGDGDASRNGSAHIRLSYAVVGITTTVTSSVGLLIGSNEAMNGTSLNDIQNSYSVGLVGTDTLIGNDTRIIGGGAGSNITSSSLLTTAALEAQSDLGAAYNLVTNQYPFLNLSSGYEVTTNQRTSPPRLYQWTGVGVDGKVGTSDDVHAATFIPEQ